MSKKNIRIKKKGIVVYLIPFLFNCNNTNNYCYSFFSQWNFIVTHLSRMVPYGTEQKGCNKEGKHKFDFTGNEQ